MKKLLDMIVAGVQPMGQRYVLLRLTHPQPLPSISPGQFVEVRVDHSPNTFLRRPISVHHVDEQHNELWLLVAVVGDGTRQMTSVSPGDVLNCLLPLGHGFTLPADSSTSTLLVGGGVGVAPLLFLGHRLCAQGVKPVFLLGARTASDLPEALLSHYQQLGTVLITTEDGTAGERGLVTQHSILTKQKFDIIYTCGPQPMMRAVARYAAEHQVECEVSLENKMACGLGACLCCVEKTTEGNVCVCKEGPVLNIKKLLWQN